MEGDNLISKVTVVGEAGYGSTQITPDKTKRDDPHLTTIPVAILNLMKSLYGAALLSFPWSFGLSTLIPGVIGIIFSSTYSLIVCLFVIYCCEQKQTYEFADLLINYHPIWQKICSIIIIYVALSSCLSYVILIGDFITLSMQSFGLMFEFDRKVYISIIGVVILTPLTLLKNMQSLKMSSIFGNFALLYVVLLIIVYAFKFGSAEGTQVIINDWNYAILVVTNVGAKGYCGSYTMPPMYEQLKQRNFKTMLFIALVSWIIVTITYIIFGVCGYYIFGSFAEGDILNNFSQDNIWFIVARLAMTISIMGTYPLIFKSLMQTVEYTFFNPNNVNGYTFSNTKCLRSGIIISINIILIVVGLVVSNVGIVSSIEGAVTILGLLCLFPILMMWDTIITQNPLFKTKSNLHNNKKYLYKIILSFLLILGLCVGISGLILQLYSL